MDFKHRGSWGDKELHVHEAFEENENTKTRRWLGYDEIRPFNIK